MSSFTSPLAPTKRIIFSVTKTSFNKRHHKKKVFHFAFFRFFCALLTLQCIQCGINGLKQQKGKKSFRLCEILELFLIFHNRCTDTFAAAEARELFKSLLKLIESRCSTSLLMFRETFYFRAKARLNSVVSIKKKKIPHFSRFAAHLSDFSN